MYIEQDTQEEIFGEFDEVPEEEIPDTDDYYYDHISSVEYQEFLSNPLQHHHE